MQFYLNLKSYHIVIAILLVAGKIGIAQNDIENWNHEITVQSEKTKLEGKTFHAYSIIVYDVKNSTMRSDIVDQITVLREDRKVKEDVLKSMQVQMPKLDMAEMDIKAEALDIKSSDDVLVKLIFLNKKHHVNPDKFPEADNVVNTLMYDLSVRLNRTVIEEEIKEAERSLAALEEYKLTSEGQQQGLEENLARVDLRLDGLKEEQSAISKRLHDEKDNLTALRKPVDGARATQEELMAYDDALKYITEIEEDFLKNRVEIQRYEEKKSELSNSILENKTAMNELPERIKKQNNMIRLLQLKLESIK